MLTEVIIPCPNYNLVILHLIITDLYNPIVWTHVLQIITLNTIVSMYLFIVCKSSDKWLFRVKI